MNAKTLKALRGSIAKWQAIVAGMGRDAAEQNCPLCEMFINNGCISCPVAESVGYTHCLATPYVAWQECCDHRTGRADTPERVAAAQAELDFLISLLPEGKAP